jgi:hypothetical protein
MKKFLVLLTMMAFSVSPAAFGGQVTADALYKNTYVQLKQGMNPTEVFANLLASARQSKISMKEILEAAVNKGYMSQDQLNTVLDVAAKNAHLAKDKDFVAKVQSGKLSAADLSSITDALQGQVKGAAYRCGYYGCYRNDHTLLIVLLIVLIILIATPVVIISG